MKMGVERRIGRVGLLSGVMAMLLLSSCTTKITPIDDGWKKAGTVKRNYPKQKDYKITLKILSGPRVFAAGKDAEISLNMKNEGSRNIRIDEWYMNEPDNVRIYYRPWRAGITEFKAAEWQCIEPEYKHPVIHFQMVISPGNKTIIKKQLPFIKKLASKPGTEQKFLIVGELTLNSVSARSQMVEVYVK